MARLKTLPSRLGQLPQRLAQPRSTGPGNAEADRSRYRDATQPWRAWYKTARWQRLRREVLLRDGYQCQQTGVLVIGKYPAPNSPVVDHKIPHHGDAVLFWDIDNLQTVSKVYHDSDKQRLERRGYVGR